MQTVLLIRKKNKLPSCVRWHHFVLYTNKGKIRLNARVQNNTALRPNSTRTVFP